MIPYRTTLKSSIVISTTFHFFTIFLHNFVVTMLVHFPISLQMSFELHMVLGEVGNFSVKKDRKKKGFGENRNWKPCQKGRDHSFSSSCHSIINRNSTHCCPSVGSVWVGSHGRRNLMFVPFCEHLLSSDNSGERQEHISRFENDLFDVLLYLHFTPHPNLLELGFNKKSAQTLTLMAVDIHGRNRDTRV